MEVKPRRFLEVKASPRGSLESPDHLIYLDDVRGVATSHVSRPLVGLRGDELRELERRGNRTEEILRKHRELLRVERVMRDLEESPELKRLKGGRVDDDDEEI